jgi:hypothetical protein
MMTDTIPDTGDTGRRFCDLVMKGGITSGIVFPTAVARLSTQYRFRHIGGTSAGAIAAAGAAAAEFRRATDRVQPGYGFAELARLPEYLGGRPERGHSRLFRLFEPEPAARRHFAILAAMLNRTSGAARVLHGSLALAWAFPLAAVLGAIPGLILVAAAHGGSPLGIVAAAIAALFAVAGGIVGAAVAATASLARLLPACEFGLVRGHSTSGDRSRLTMAARLPAGSRREAFRRAVDVRRSRRRIARPGDRRTWHRSADDDDRAVAGSSLFAAVRQRAVLFQA